MSATGEISIIGRTDWVVRLGEAISRWGRRRLVRADLAARAERTERRAELEERLLLEKEIRDFGYELDRLKSLGALYRGM